MTNEPFLTNDQFFQLCFGCIAVSMVLGMLVLLFCKDDDEEERKQERWRAERADRLEAKLKQKEEGDVD